MSNRMCGVIVGAASTLVYTIILTIVFFNTQIVYVLYGYIGCPVLFVLCFFLGYSLKAGFIGFLTPSMVHSAYDNPVDNYYRSPHDKRVGSVVLTIGCFVPMLIFFILFAWLFYLYHK